MAASQLAKRQSNLIHRESGTTKMITQNYELVNGM